MPRQLEHVIHGAVFSPERASRPNHCVGPKLDRCAGRKGHDAALDHISRRKRGAAILHGERLDHPDHVRDEEGCSAGARMPRLHSKHVAAAGGQRRRWSIRLVERGRTGVGRARSHKCLDVVDELGEILFEIGGHTRRQLRGIRRRIRSVLNVEEFERLVQMAGPAGGLHFRSPTTRPTHAGNDQTRQDGEDARNHQQLSSREAPGTTASAY